jgi:integrase/recombinase XerD
MKIHSQKRRSVKGKPNDPLGDYPRQFREVLQRRGYPPGTVRIYDRRVERLGELMRRRRLTTADLSPQEVGRLLAVPGWPPAHHGYAKTIVRRFIEFLIEQGAGVPVPKLTAKQKARAALRRDYEAYLRNQRGLSEETIYNSWRLADRFMEFYFGDKVGTFAKITPTDIVRFMQQLHGRAQPYRVTTTSTHLRAFFLFLFQTGRTKANLALTIPSIAHRYGARLRRYLTPEQVEAVLAAVRSDTPMGRRNYAMMLLMARLGLRAPEVIAIRMDDIDWRASEIIVRGKGQRHDRLPLPEEVGQALAEYIRRDRVTTVHEVFVIDRAPHRSFKDSQLLNVVLKNAFEKTGVKPPAPYVGSHVLRHSLATQLVRRGASLEEIANLLRHRSRATTMIYAKLDVEGLRSIAQPWPVGGAQ